MIYFNHYITIKERIIYMEVFLSSHNLMANKLYRNKITTQALRFADGPTYNRRYCRSYCFSACFLGGPLLKQPHFKLNILKERHVPVQMINQCNAMSRGNFLYFMFNISVESRPLTLGSQPSRVQIVAAFLPIVTHK